MLTVTPCDFSVQAEYSFVMSSSAAESSNGCQTIARQITMTFEAGDISRLAGAACLFAGVIVGRSASGYSDTIARASLQCLNDSTKGVHRSDSPMLPSVNGGASLCSRWLGSVAVSSSQNANKQSCNCLRSQVFDSEIG